MRLFQINGDTPLHTAVKDQNLEMVQLLLKRGDIDPNKVNKVCILCYIGSVNYQIQFLSIYRIKYFAHSLYY